MKWCVWIFTVGSLFSLTRLQPPERIAWQQDMSLDWSHFRGASDPLAGFSASSSTGLSQAYEIDHMGRLHKEGTKVTAHFYPDFSWFMPTDTTDHLLRHERAHFDITEIHARLLRKEIQDFEFTTNAKSEIKALYQNIESRRQHMQRQFDIETDHSRKRLLEAQWHQKIRKLLETYQSFAL